MIHNGIEYGMMQAFAEASISSRPRIRRACPRTSVST
ncbi:hypothetical protein QNM99_20930 [Pseudomonas sp. PCH446]